MRVSNPGGTEGGVPGGRKDAVPVARGLPGDVVTGGHPPAHPESLAVTERTE